MRLKEKVKRIEHISVYDHLELPEKSEGTILKESFR